MYPEVSRYLRKRSLLYSEVLRTCKFLLKYSNEAKEARNYLNERISSSSQDNFEFG